MLESRDQTNVHVNGDGTAVNGVRDFTGMDDQTKPRTLALVVAFIGEQLELHRSKHLALAGAKAERMPPLFIGVQGPQGCGTRFPLFSSLYLMLRLFSRRDLETGKSYICELLPTILASKFDPLFDSPNRPLSVVSLSLDDIYLPHTGLITVAEKYASNRMLQGRGPPGTHDLDLGTKVLRQLSQINAVDSQSVDLPIFDKSLFNGRGDRIEAVKRVEGPVDIVLFEGWMLGFTALPPALLHSLYTSATRDPKAFARENLDYDVPFFIEHEEKDWDVINTCLADDRYNEMWSRLNAFIQLRPGEMGFTWEWRLEVL